MVVPPRDDPDQGLLYETAAQDLRAVSAKRYWAAGKRAARPREHPGKAGHSTTPSAVRAQRTNCLRPARCAARCSATLAVWSAPSSTASPPRVASSAIGPHGSVSDCLASSSSASTPTNDRIG